MDNNRILSLYIETVYRRRQDVIHVYYMYLRIHNNLKIHSYLFTRIGIGVIL